MPLIEGSTANENWPIPKQMSAATRAIEGKRRVIEGLTEGREGRGRGERWEGGSPQPWVSGENQHTYKNSGTEQNCPVPQFNRNYQLDQIADQFSAIDDF